MKLTKHDTNMTTAQHRLFASLRAFVGADGSGAPSHTCTDLQTPPTRSSVSVRSLIVASICAPALLFSTATASAAPPSPTAPSIEEEFTSDVGSTSATLSARVNPGGAETTFEFELAPAGGAFSPVIDPAANGSIPAGSTGVALGVPLQQGLAPSVSYEFRVVVSNSAQTVTGEPVSFTTQGAGGKFLLPDGRQWEMVSPPKKEGAFIESITEFGLIKAAADGEAVSYHSSLPTEAEPLGFAEQVQSIATRGPAGWQARNLTVPHGTETGPDGDGEGSEYRFFSEDLSLAAVQPLGPFTPCETPEGAPQPCLSPEASEQTAFLHTDYFAGSVSEPCTTGMACDKPLVTGCPATGSCPLIVKEHADVPPGTLFGLPQETKGTVTGRCITTFACGPWFVAATPDLSHVVLESDTSLTTGSPGPSGLYEWSSGKLSFIGTGGNEPLENTVQEGGAGYYAANGPHGISADGSRVIFGGKSQGVKGESLEGLLLRDTAQEETVKIGEGQFQGADAEDTRIFFSSEGELKVFDAASGAKPLTGSVTALTQGAGQLGHILGASEDGTYVYFVSAGVLPGSGAAGVGNNLYVDHFDGSGWQPSFIAALSSEDSGEWTQGLTQQQARVSPNGEWLAFTSSAPLAGYDNRDVDARVPDAEVYDYHVSTGALVCASCDPTGARPEGFEFAALEPDNGGLVGGPRGTWPATALVAANLPGPSQLDKDAYTEDYQARYLSDSGRLFFDSGDALVPQDANRTQDVYEYEPEGVGSCTSASSSGSVVFKPTRGYVLSGRPGKETAGCVALISSGNSGEESAFLDASETGGDVFLLTSAKLAPQDDDTALDVYDAHECTTASPCTSAQASPPPCDTEASCRPSPTPQPAIYGVPSSATFSGPGALPAPSRAATAKPTALTRAQKLAAALKSCKKDRKKSARDRCNRQAHRRFGPVKRVTKPIQRKGSK